MDENLAVKFVDGSTDTVEGWLAPYNGPEFLGGKDWHGEYFSPATDFALDWFGDWQRPLLYQHGLDDAVKTEVVGRIRVEARDKGLWMQAQLDAASEYHAEIAALVAEGALGASSGSVAHLVQRSAKTGEIKRWPVIEGSLTPTPANPQATVGYAVKSTDAILHLGVIGTEVPEDITGAGPIKGVDTFIVGDQGPEKVIRVSGDEVFRAVDASVKAGARHSAADYSHIQSAHDAMVSLGAVCSPPATETKAESAPTPPEPAATPMLGIKASEPVANDEDVTVARELFNAYAVKVARDLLR